jgi:hypothetical protein
MTSKRRTQTMNPDGDDYGYSFEEEMIAIGRKQERKALANTLTRLRAEVIKTSDVAAKALDDVAKNHGIRTETIVRYIA